MFKTCCAIVVSGTALLGSLDHEAATLDHFTNFSALPAGTQAPDLGPAVFNDPGEIQFFATGPFYVPGSNRAWGFFGDDTARIDFTEPTVTEVVLQARGSDGQTRNNTGEILGQSKVSVAAYDQLGNLIGTPVGFTNDGFTEATFTAPEGDYISWLSLINTGDAASTALIGEIGFNVADPVVPEPASLALLGSGGALMLIRRRR